jgi:RNA polymerase sigma factor (TIGR02999 family)
MREAVGLRLIEKASFCLICGLQRLSRILLDSRLARIHNLNEIGGGRPFQRIGNRNHRASSMQVTQILSAIEAGDPHATGQLLPIVYDELRKIAASQLAREKPGQTLQATALVHEAWLRLVGPGSGPHWDGRGHFFSAAAEAMRRILVDIARRKLSTKHGGEMTRQVLSDLPVDMAPCTEVLAVHEALDQLARENPQVSELVKLHYFGCLSLEEVAECLSISRAQAYRKWKFARAWLRTALEDKSIGNDKAG